MRTEGRDSDGDVTRMRGVVGMKGRDKDEDVMQVRERDKNGDVTRMGDVARIEGRDKGSGHETDG